MAEKLPKNRKRKHFEIAKSRQSPFQNSTSKPASAPVVSTAPRGINAVEFAESRALEIQNMMMAVANASSGSKRVFQSVPRHMRRRAASYNSKRMPVRLREAYNREAAKTREKMKEPKKKQSRQHRRRPSNLLEEYNRRQRKHVWLETHIWHAKRFKMEERWGYKIPLHPNDKSIKASYRAMATGCLMQDVSYYQCIEVSGEQESIIATMKHLTNSEAGLTMAGKQYLSGSREGHVVLYKYDKYPWNAIGPVMFLWQQHLCHGVDIQADKEIANDNSVVTKLWVWSHPACRDEVLSEIVHACSLEGHTELTDEKVELDEKNGTESKKPKVSLKSNPCNEPAKFSVTVLNEQLARFRLTGPKSHALLASTLDVCEWGVTGSSTGSRWWQGYGSGEDHRRRLSEQNAVWDEMKGVASPGVLPSGAVVALVVKDPRLGLPLRKSSVDMASEELYQEPSEELTIFPSCTAGSAFSALWDPSVREEVKKTKLAEKELNELRSKMVVPGSKLDLGDDTSRIPILLIQQPGTKGDFKTCPINFGCGYDVVIPAGWSMAFWIALVYRGARVGGSRELATCSREQALPHFPCDFPDTEAGREYKEEQSRTAGDKYTRYPPAKRPNYEKLGVASPFGGDWERLLDEWGKEVDRLETDLEKLSCSGNREEGKFPSVDGKLDKAKQVEDIQSRVGENVEVTDEASLMLSSVVTSDEASLMPSSSIGVAETVASTGQTSPVPSSRVGEAIEATNETSPMTSSVATTEQVLPMPSFVATTNQVFAMPSFVATTDQVFAMSSFVATTDQVFAMPSFVATTDQVLPCPSSVATTDQVLPCPSSVATTDQVLPCPSSVATTDQVLPMPSSVATTDQVLPCPSSVATTDQVLPCPSSVATSDQILPMPSSIATTDQVLPMPSSVATTDQVLPMPSSVATTDQGLPMPSSAATSDQILPMPSSVQTTDEPSPMPSSVQTTDEPSPMPSSVQTTDEPSPMPSFPTRVGGTAAPHDPASPMPSSSNCTRFSVIRTHSTRRRLQQLIQSLQHTSSAKTNKLSKSIAFGEHFEFLRKNIAPYTRALLCLDLLVLFKGCPLVNAVIFIPTAEDLRSLKKDKNYGGPVEHVHTARKNESSTASTSTTLVGGCSRKAIGFISSGQYSFARGQGAAVGFCTFPGFCELVLGASSQRCPPLVLIRNTTSFQYRFASFNLV